MQVACQLYFLFLCYATYVVYLLELEAPRGSVLPCSLKIMHWSSQSTIQNSSAPWKYFVLLHKSLKLIQLLPKSPKNVSQFSLKCKPNNYVSWSTSELWVWLAHCDNGFSPPVKYFTDHSKAVLRLWISYVISVLFLLFFRVRLFIDTLWSPAGQRLTSLLSCVMSNCKVVTFPLVSLFKRDAWDLCPLSYFALSVGLISFT